MGAENSQFSKEVREPLNPSEGLSNHQGSGGHSASHHQDSASNAGLLLLDEEEAGGFHSPSLLQLADQSPATTTDTDAAEIATGNSGELEAGRSDGRRSRRAGRRQGRDDSDSDGEDIPYSPRLGIYRQYFARFAGEDNIMSQRDFRELAATVCHIWQQPPPEDSEITECLAKYNAPPGQGLTIEVFAACAEELLQRRAAACRHLTIPSVEVLARGWSGRPSNRGCILHMELPTRNLSLYDMGVVGVSVTVAEVIGLMSAQGSLQSDEQLHCRVTISRRGIILPRRATRRTVTRPAIMGQAIPTWRFEEELLFDDPTVLRRRGELTGAVLVRNAASPISCCALAVARPLPIPTTGTVELPLVDPTTGKMQGKVILRAGWPTSDGLANYTSRRIRTWMQENCWEEARMLLQQLQGEPLRHVAGRECDHGRTLLMEAARRGQSGTAILRDLLLESMPEWFASDYMGASAVHHAASSGSVESLAALLGSGLPADAHASGLNNATPLMLAAYRGSKDHLELLLGFGAQASSLDANGLPAVAWALGQPHQLSKGLERWRLKDFSDEGPAYETTFLQETLLLLLRQLWAAYPAASTAGFHRTAVKTYWFPVVDMAAQHPLPDALYLVCDEIGRLCPSPSTRRALLASLFVEALARRAETLAVRLAIEQSALDLEGGILPGNSSSGSFQAAPTSEPSSAAGSATTLASGEGPSSRPPGSGLCPNSSGVLGTTPPTAPGPAGGPCLGMKPLSSLTPKARAGQRALQQAVEAELPKLAYSLLRHKISKLESPAEAVRVLRLAAIRHDDNLTQEACAHLSELTINRWIEPVMLGNSFQDCPVCAQPLPLQKPVVLCKEETGAGRGPRKLACTHIICESCSSQVNGRCPLCRSEFVGHQHLPHPSLRPFSWFRAVLALSSSSSPSPADSVGPGGASRPGGPEIDDVEHLFLDAEPTSRPYAPMEVIEGCSSVSYNSIPWNSEAAGGHPAFSSPSSSGTCLRAAPPREGQAFLAAAHPQQTLQSQTDNTSSNDNNSSSADNNNNNNNTDNNNNNNNNNTDNNDSSTFVETDGEGQRPTGDGDDRTEQTDCQKQREHSRPSYTCQKGHSFSRAELENLLTATMAVDPVLLSNALDKGLWEKWDADGDGRLSVRDFFEPDGLLRWLLVHRPIAKPLPNCLEHRERWFVQKVAERNPAIKESDYESRESSEQFLRRSEFPTLHYNLTHRIYRDDVFVALLQLTGASSFDGPAELDFLRGFVQHAYPKWADRQGNSFLGAAVDNGIDYTSWALPDGFLNHLWEFAELALVSKALHRLDIGEASPQNEVEALFRLHCLALGPNPTSATLKELSQGMPPITMTNMPTCEEVIRSAKEYRGGRSSSQSVESGSKPNLLINGVPRALAALESHPHHVQVVGWAARLVLVLLLRFSRTMHLMIVETATWPGIFEAFRDEETLQADYEAATGLELPVDALVTALIAAMRRLSASPRGAADQAFMGTTASVGLLLWCLDWSSPRVEVPRRLSELCAGQTTPSLRSFVCATTCLTVCDLPGVLRWLQSNLLGQNLLWQPPTTLPPSQVGLNQHVEVCAQHGWLTGIVRRPPLASPTQPRDECWQVQCREDSRVYSRHIWAPGWRKKAEEALARLRYALLGRYTCVPKTPRAFAKTVRLALMESVIFKGLLPKACQPPPTPQGVVLRGSNNIPVQAGDQVWLSVTVERAKSLQTPRHGEWTDQRTFCLEFPGRVVETLTGPFRARISHGSLGTFLWNPVLITQALSTPATLPFEEQYGPIVIGDEVLLSANQDKVVPLQFGHGGWSTRMSHGLGRFGRVTTIYQRGDVRLDVPGCGSFVWNPAVIEPPGQGCVTTLCAQASTSLDDEGAALFLLLLLGELRCDGEEAAEVAADVLAVLERAAEGQPGNELPTGLRPFAALMLLASVVDLGPCVHYPRVRLCHPELPEVHLRDCVDAEAMDLLSTSPATLWDAADTGGISFADVVAGKAQVVPAVERWLLAFFCGRHRRLLEPRNMFSMI